MFENGSEIRCTWKQAFVTWEAGNNYPIHLLNSPDRNISYLTSKEEMVKLPALLHAAKHMAGLVDLVNDNNNTMNNNKNNTTPGTCGGTSFHPTGLLPTPSSSGFTVAMTRTPFYIQPSHQAGQQQHQQAFQPAKSSDSPLDRSLSAGGNGATANKRKNKAPERVAAAAAAIPPPLPPPQFGKPHGGMSAESEEQSINKDTFLQGLSPPLHPPPSSMDNTDMNNNGRPKILKWDPLKKKGDATATLTNTITTTMITTTVSNPDAQKKKKQKTVEAIAVEECVERQKSSDSDDDNDYNYGNNGGKNNNNNNGDDGEAYRGVYRTSDGIYKVCLSIDGCKKVIGFYRSVKEAALAYDYSARQYHHNNPVLNFPRLNANPRAISQEALMKVKKRRQDERVRKMLEREIKRIRQSSNNNDDDDNGDEGHRSRGRPIIREEKEKEKEKKKKKGMKVEESEESDGGGGNDKDLPGAKRRRSMKRGPDLVGRRIRVFWPAEGRWFSGYVTQYRSDPPSLSSSKHHFITYDDGDKDWVDLTCEKYKLVLREEQDKQEKQQRLKKKTSKTQRGEGVHKQKKEQMKERERRAQDRVRNEKRAGGGSSSSSRRDGSSKSNNNNKRSRSTNGGFDQYKKDKNGKIITNSKYLGVTLYHGSRGWRSRICYNNQISELGIFETEVAAAKAYDAMARKLMGGDAWKKVNFPTSAEVKMRNR